MRGPGFADHPLANRDAILVADGRRTAEVKSLVDGLRGKRRVEADTHARVPRPWAWYQVVDFGDGFQVKRIHVAPGGRLSLQKHNHRAEHWVVVGGTAFAAIGTTVQRIAPNEHVHIALGAVHPLENPGDERVELVAVQGGTYPGKDDIVRLEDV